MTLLGSISNETGSALWDQNPGFHTTANHLRGGIVSYGSSKQPTMPWLSHAALFVADVPEKINR